MAVQVPLSTARPDVVGPASPEVRAVASVPRRPGDLGWFFGLSFGLTWGIAAALLLARDRVEAAVGPFSTTNPLYVLAVYAPSLTGVVLTAVRSGRPGLRELGCRLLRRGVRGRWFALVLLGWPLADLVARLLQWGLTGEPLQPLLLDGTPPTTLSDWYLAPALLEATLLLDAGPLGEELGWRGYALPRLLPGRSGRLGAAVLLGLVWGLWHLPAFWISGTHQHDDGAGIFWLVLGTVASSVIMTWLYLRTGGSILVAGILVHLMNNSAVADLWAFDLVMLVPATIAGVALLQADRRGRLVP